VWLRLRDESAEDARRRSEPQQYQFVSIGFEGAVLAEAAATTISELAAFIP
jgi:hypothetical protein